MLNLDYKKLNKEYADLKTMREVANKCPFEQSQKIRKEQKKKYNHYKFMMELSKRMGGDIVGKY